MNPMARLLSVLALAVIDVPQSQSATPPDSADPEPQLPYAAKYVSYPAVLNNNAITVFEDIRGSGGRVRYAIPPYLYPVWGEFKSAVSAACNDRPENEVARVHLKVQLASKAVSEQVVEDLAKANVKTSTSEIHAFPTVMLSIRTGGSDGIPLVNRWTYPNLAPDQINDKVAVSITPHTTIEEIPIEDTCEQLVRIAQSARNLNGIYFSKNNTIKVNTVMASYSGFLRSEALNSLLVEETQSGGKTVTSRGRSGGVGLNFGKVFGGTTSSKQVGEAVDSRRRAVTGNLIQDAALDYAKVFSLTYRAEMAAEGFDENAIATLLINFITTNAAKAEAVFTKTGDDWTVTIDKVISRTLDRSTVSDLLKTSGNPSLKGENFESAAGSYGSSDASAAAPPAEGQSPAPASSGGGIGGSTVNQQKAEFTDSRSIEWNRSDSGEWVPTKVNLHYLSENDLMSEVSAAYQRVIATPNSGFLLTKMDVFYTDGSVAPDVTLLASVAPEKVIKPIPGGAYKTVAIDAAGKEVGTAMCPGTDITGISGMTLVGGEEDRADDTAQCATNWCGSNGLSCKTYLRKPGCYVSQKWYVWYMYRQGQENGFVSLSEICSPPVVPGTKREPVTVASTDNSPNQLEKAVEDAVNALTKNSVPLPLPAGLPGVPGVKDKKVEVPTGIPGVKVKIKLPKIKL